MQTQTKQKQTKQTNQHFKEKQPFLVLTSRYKIECEDITNNIIDWYDVHENPFVALADTRDLLLTLLFTNRCTFVCP